MKDFVTPFKVGLVVLVALLATTYMVAVLTTGEGWGKPEGYTVYATFDDVTGLAKNSHIRMSGRPVGRLLDFELQGDEVRVVMSIRKDVTLWEGEKQPDGTWRNGATVKRTSSGMLGDYFLQVTPGAPPGEGEDWGKLGDDDEIHNVVEGQGMEDVMESIQRNSKNIEEVTETMSAVFGGPEAQKSLKQIIEDLRVMLETMRGFVDENSEKVDRILANTEEVSRDLRAFSEKGTQSLENIMSDAEQIVQEVKFIVGQSSGDVQAGLGTLRGTLGRLQTTLDSLNYSLQNIQDITDKVNEGEGTVGHVVNDKTLINRAERILEDVENFTGRIDRLKAFVNLRTEYHVRHQSFKNIVGLRLQPSENKYYLAEFIDDYRGKTTVVREDVNTTRGDIEDGQYRTTTVTTTDDFKFSFQLARSLRLTDWAKLTGRFGIIESSGGVGGNVVLLENDTLDMQADVFQFGLGQYPRFRGFASWDILKFAYIAGGIDDALNADRRDYFIGAGLEFNDEDLKALLTTTGVPAQ